MNNFIPSEGSPLYLTISDHIEKQISSGKLKNNERLPTTAEMARQFNVTIPTIQKGLSRLSKKGLIRRSPKLGTFVNACQLSRTIAIVFGHNPFKLETAYYTIFLEALKQSLSEAGFGFDCHFGLIWEGYQAGLQRLKNEIDEGKYAALLVIAPSMELGAWLGGQRLLPAFNLPPFDVRYSAYSGLSHLLKQGVEKVKFVPLQNPAQNSSYYQEELAGARQAFSEAGMDWRKENVCYLGDSIQSAYVNTRTLFKDMRKRPQGLFINHDVVTKGALSALNELGIRIPDDCKLATHSNKGDKFLCSIPLTRCEVDPVLGARDTVRYLKDQISEAAAGISKLDISIRTALVVGKSCGEK